MLKYFLKILFTLIFLKLLSRIALGSVILLTPSYGEVLDDTVAHFTWQDTDFQEEYIYRHILYINSSLYGSAIARIIEERELTRGVSDFKIYLWRVQYHPKDTFDGVFDFESDVSVFSTNKDIPQEFLDMYLTEEEKDVEGEGEEEDEGEKDEIQKEEGGEENYVEKEEKDVVENDKGESSKVKVQDIAPFLEDAQETIAPGNIQSEEIANYKLSEEKNERDGNRTTSQNRYVIDLTEQDNYEDMVVQEREFTWNISSSKSVLGVSKQEDVVCKYKYVRRGEKLEKIYCNVPKINISEEIKYPFANEYLIYLSGEVVTNFTVQIDNYDCDFSLLRPTTWFRCEERFVESTLLPLQPHMLFHIYKKNSRLPVRSFFLDDQKFKILAGYVKDAGDLRLVHKYRLISTNFNLLYDLESEYTLRPKTTAIESGEKDSGKKPFSFPFNKTIGVTQWYGYTAYQSPHAGIDFGAKKEGVLAVGDGVVVSKGWDGYEGKCLSGGNYLIVKHENGMHTTYFHLEAMYVNTGDFVKKGQVIAKSGNTGAWNCQRLGYHLHFETRLNASSSSHSNPVEYIDVDWNKVPTLGYKTYPGRLTGENPHPGR